MMIDSIPRVRPLLLLIITVGAQVLLLAFQIKGEQNVPLIRRWAAAVVTPFERGGTATFSSFGNVWKGYIGLRNARAENEQMRAEMQRLQLRNQQLESQNAEAQRLASLLNFHDTHPEIEMLAASVIGSSSDSTSHTLFLNRGSNDHIRVNQPVITPDGVVGKIVEVFPRSSQVQLINDQNSGVGALFSGTRTHGIVKGKGDPEPQMDYVANEEKIQPGDIVVTSGEDRIFPKDLYVGKVEWTKPGGNSTPFQVIRITPAARLDRLEDVIVLLTTNDMKLSRADNVTGGPTKEAEAKAAAIAAAQAANDAAAQPSQASIISSSPATGTTAAHAGAAAPAKPAPHR
jgi:rod shape-determining protein MreC